MNNRRSYLDSMNAGRRRRASTSLEQLSTTLEELESRITRPHDERRDDDRYGSRPSPEASYHDGERRAPLRDSRLERFHRPSAREEGLAGSAAMSGELRALREELRHQMSAGLRREFAALKTDIERALQAPAPAPQAAALGEEFERLSTIIHKLAEKSDDRQVGLLQREMEQVKQTLGKLAREETVRSFDRRWDEMDRRWNDLASQVTDTRGGDDPALRALSDRLEQIGEAVSALPTSLSLRSLEEKMKLLASTVDQFSHHRDRIGPEAIGAIEDRLDEISRAVAASGAGRSAELDPEPFERIEARISSLARQLAEVMQDGQTGDLTQRIEVLSRRVEDIAHRVDLPDQSIERLADRIDTISRKIDDAPAMTLTSQLEALSRRVEDIAYRVDLPDQTVERLAGQIDAISRKLEDGPALPDLDHAFHGIESRFASLSDMLEQRHEDALVQGRNLFRDLEQRLGDVTARINARDVQPSAVDATLIEAMDARFSELASRIERQAAAPADSGAIRDLEARLESISARIEASVRQPGVEPSLIRSLEAQIADLASHIAAPAASAPGADDIRPRLDQIEQSIADSRHDVLEAARRAAEEAVRSFSGGPREGALIAELADDLKSLEALSRRSDERNAKTFEAIHDTLLKIVDRLGAVENGVQTAKPVQRGSFAAAQTPPLAPSVEAMPLAAAEMDEPAAVAPPAAAAAGRRTAASAAAEAAAEAVRGDAEAVTAGRSMLGGLARALKGRRSKRDKPEEVVPPVLPAQPASARQAPAPSVEIDAPLDPQVVNQPLEPGSGAPDLNAIMKRVRDERGQQARGPDAETAKSDFIAAARRAAQAAAAEAEMMKRGPAAKVKAGGSGLGEMLKSRRKPVLMGIAAVLIALAAFQFGKPLLSRGSEVAQAPAAAPAPIVAEAGVLEPLAPSVALEEGIGAADEVTGTTVPEAGAAAEAPQEGFDATNAWLDTGTVTTLAPEELAEMETTPEPSEDVLAAIPQEAGPAALREAAAAGDPKALYEIGHRYAEGRGVPEDMARAIEWYERAAEQGLAPAQYRIGNLYEKGIGVERDVTRAKTWYQLAAGQGNASAMHNLAVLYAMGADGTTDNETAARWFTEAAELGVKDSQFNLGILSAKGVGMTQNLEEAYKWFALVAKAGDKDAAEKRDEIANALRPDQLERARAAAELWRAKPLDPEANAVELPESWSESGGTTASIDMKQAVRNIQEILNKNGYQAGSPDGVMGQRTKTAIAAFQKDNGMQPTGEIDEPLVRALLDRR